MSNQIARLPISERARLYRQMSIETLQLAEASAVPEAKMSFLRLSRCWASLAEEMSDEADETGSAYSGMLVRGTV